MSSNIRVNVANPEHIDDLKDLTKQLVEGLGQKFDPKRFDWGIRRRLYDPLQRHGILIAVDEDSDEFVGTVKKRIELFDKFQKFE